MTVATRFEIVSEPHASGSLAKWAGEKFGAFFSPPATFIGLVNNGRIVCVSIFNDYTGDNVELSVAADGIIPRRFLQFCAEYAFNQLGCNRVTARSRASNKRVASLAKRLGFEVEGRLRQFYGDEDAILYGLLRNEAGSVFRRRLQ